MIPHTQKTFSISRLFLAFILLISLLATFPAGTAIAAGGLCYVKQDATGTGTGLSWTNAYAGNSGLQNALSNVNCTNIWVAAGTYTPGASRSDTFQLKNNVTIYGGFNGTETTLDQRAIVQNQTILSGEIGTSALTNNSYHVVTGSGTNSTAVLNGFTIQHGYANGSSPNNSGGGVYIDSGTPSIENVVLQDNYATGAGGGMFIKNSSFGLTALNFLKNEALAAGGGLYNLSSNITLSNSTFWRNNSTNGAAIFNNGSSPTFKNLTIYEHPYGSTTTAAIHNTNSSHLTMHNTIIWDTFSGTDVYIYTTNSTATITYSVLEDGCPSGASCTNIITSEPTTYNVAPDFHGGNMEVKALLPASSAINAGNNATCASLDQRGFPRAGQGACDIGAYEFYPTVFVKPGGATKGFCDSWTNACELSYADDVLAPGMEAWVKAGTYKPGTLRSDSFQFGNGFGGDRGGGAYGGFIGTETARSQRNPVTNPTILSGDIGTQGVDNDNSYHVVELFAPVDFTLDGFTITKGYTNNVLGNDGDGAGIWLSASSSSASMPVNLRNLNISYNRAYRNGGGLNITNYGTTILENVTFFRNSTPGLGGGIYKAAGGSVIVNASTFEENQAATGAGMTVLASTTYPVSLSITGTSFIWNTSVGSEGGAAVRAEYSDLDITNSTFYGSDAANSGNYSIVCNVGCGAWSFTNITMQHEDGIRAAQYGNLTIRNSILWDQSNLFNGLFDTLSINHSVLEGGCPAGASCTGVHTTNPVLGTLGQYGGPTKTIPISTSGSAFNAADLNTCPVADQRGISRPQGSACDIGAFEKEYASVVLKSSGKQDGWILEQSENSGKGETKNSLAKLLYIGDDALNRQYRAILSFNTAGIPDNAVITKVTLKLKKAGVVGKVPFKTYKGLRVDIKKPRFGTKATLQPGDFQAKASKLLVGKFPARLRSGWYVSTLYSTAHPFINLTGLTQFRVRFYRDDNNDFGADFLKIHSGNALKAYRPQLIVEYYIP